MFMRYQAQFAVVVWMLVVCTQPFFGFSDSLPESGETVSKRASRQSFKFDPDDRQVLVPVQIGGKEYPFVLDTGFTGSVFDASLRPHLGRRIDTKAIRDPFNNEVTLDLYDPPDARVGSLPMGKHPVACHDLSQFREAFGSDIRGVLGMEFLKDWIISIDFVEGRLDFLPPGTAKKPEWGESVPCAYDAKGMLQICATVGKDVETSFEVDTGDAGTGSLEEAFLTLLVDLHEARMIGHKRCLTASGLHSPQVTRLSHLAVGPFQHDNLRFASASRNDLGLGYFSRYRVTIDFPKQRLYLAKGKRFADRDHGNTSGLFLLFKARGIEIESVDGKGPAYAAGVRAKDVIVALGGKPVAAWKSSAIHRALRAESGTVRMTIERGGKRIDMCFTLHE